MQCQPVREYHFVMRAMLEMGCHSGHAMDHGPEEITGMKWIML